MFLKEPLTAEPRWTLEQVILKCHQHFTIVLSLFLRSMTKTALVTSVPLGTSHAPSSLTRLTSGLSSDFNSELTTSSTFLQSTTLKLLMGLMITVLLSGTPSSSADCNSLSLGTTIATGYSVTTGSVDSLWFLTSLSNGSELDSLVPQLQPTLRLLPLYNKLQTDLTCSTGS